MPAGEYTVAGLLGLMGITKANNFAAAAAVLALMACECTKISDHPDGIVCECTITPCI